MIERPSAEISGVGAYEKVVDDGFWRKKLGKMVKSTRFEALRIPERDALATLVEVLQTPERDAPATIFYRSKMLRPH
jgi:hypothetical protein